MYKKVLKEMVDILESKGIAERKQVNINGKSYKIIVFEKDGFVYIEGHKRKLYDIKKGILFTYNHKSVYIKLHEHNIIKAI